MGRQISALLCGAAMLAGSVAVAADAPHFFYVVKDGNDVWFLNEVAGAKAEAEKLGAGFTSQNVELNANLAITGVDNAIAGGADGIVIVVPEQQIGPAVLKKATDAGIPMIAVDDGIVDEAGKSAPFVGFSSVDAGKQVGNAIADIYGQMGWPKPGPGDGDHHRRGADGQRVHGSHRQCHRGAQGSPRA